MASPEPGESGNHGNAIPQKSIELPNLLRNSLNPVTVPQDRCSFWHFPPSLDERLVLTLVPEGAFSRLCCPHRMDRPARLSLSHSVLKAGAEVTSEGAAELRSLNLGISARGLVIKAATSRGVPPSPSIGALCDQLFCDFYAPHVAAMREAICIHIGQARRQTSSLV